MGELTINASLFKDMLVTGAAILEKNKRAIDALNVFPVPDGDTGTNMSMTMQSAIKEIQHTEALTVSEVASALSLGALKGARGNSGVILSQLFRGFARSLKGIQEMDAQLFAAALKNGSDAAYKAVMKPKEGTMLTVARVVSEEAEKAASSGANIYKLMDVIMESGENTLRMTPELLPILKEANVVDSGGKGLLAIYQGFKMVLDGEEIIDYEVAEETKPSTYEESFSGADMDEEDIKFTYCTEFFISNLNPDYSAQELERFREKLVRIGDSVVVVEDMGIVKVHVHSNAPGKILQFALRLGEIGKIKIDNMRQQLREKQSIQKANEKEFGVVAISTGDGIEKVFKDLVVDYVLPGGATMNPSIDDIAKAVRKVNARNVFILPNNPNIILAAQQADKLTDKKVVVIPTKSIPQGIAAIMAYNPDLSIEENEKRMKNAIGKVRSGSVTFAVRDTAFNGLNLHEGDIIGMNGGNILFAGKSVEGVSKDLLKEMIGDDGEFVTILYGNGITEDEANELADSMSKEYEDCDFVVQYGGQPLYYYIFSVE